MGVRERAPDERGDAVPNSSHRPVRWTRHAWARREHSVGRWRWRVPGTRRQWGSVKKAERHAGPGVVVVIRRGGCWRGNVQHDGRMGTVACTSRVNKAAEGGGCAREQQERGKHEASTSEGESDGVAPATRQRPGTSLPARRCCTPPRAPPTRSPHVVPPARPPSPPLHPAPSHRHRSPNSSQRTWSLVIMAATLCPSWVNTKTTQYAQRARMVFMFGCWANCAVLGSERMEDGRGRSGGECGERERRAGKRREVERSE